MCMVAVLTPNDGREAADRRCANAKLGALHGAVRSRTRVCLEQAPARRWNSSDFCRDCPSHFHEVDFRSWFFLRRMGAPLSRPPDRREPSCVFPGTDLFAGWADLGRKRSMDVPNGHAPQADLGRYSATRCDEVEAAISIVCAKSKILRGGGGLYERFRRQFCR